MYWNILELMSCAGKKFEVTTFAERVVLLGHKIVGALLKRSTTIENSQILHSAAPSRSSRQIHRRDASKADGNATKSRDFHVEHQCA